VRHRGRGAFASAKEDGRHEVQHGHLVLLDDLQQRVQVEALHQDLMRAAPSAAFISITP